MTYTIDTLTRNRRNLMIGIALTFAIWQIPQMDMLSNLNTSLKSILTGIGTIGGLAWVLMMVFLVIIQKRLTRASSDTKAALEDELVTANRLNAVKFGYIILFGLTAVLFALCQFVEISGTDVARALMIAGVCAPLLSFGFMEG